ncbi:MAG: DUF5625 family protein [Planctomycetota bacterium]
MTGDAGTIRPKRNFIRTAIVTGGLLLAIAAGRAANFPPVLFMLWGLGEVVIPVWEKIDPIAPRLPILPNDLRELKDAEARGKALRATVDKFYGTLPESNKSWLREILAPPYVGAAGVDVSKIVRHYIPAGTPFAEAERTLRAAGMTIVWPRLIPSDVMPPLSGLTQGDSGVEAALKRQTSEPPGYMRLHVQMLPQNSGEYGDDSPVGKVTASLSKQIGAPIPPVSFAFDASKASTVVDTTIKVDKTRFYQFELLFRGARPADMAALNKLAGDAYLGDSYVDKRYKPPDPGVVVPVRVVITADQHVVYDRTVKTQGHYSFTRLAIHRRAGGIELIPGLYRIQVSTIEDIPELSAVTIEFSVSYDARF